MVAYMIPGRAQALINSWNRSAFAQDGMPNDQYPFQVGAPLFKDTVLALELNACFDARQPNRLCPLHCIGTVRAFLCGQCRKIHV